MRHRVMTSWTRLRPWFTPSEEAVRRWVVMQSLVTIESIDEWFGDLIERAAAHPEIRTYIREQQKEDPDFYMAFQDMAEKIAKLNPVSRSSRPSLRAPPSRR
jgi:hypothetical protein